MKRFDADVVLDRVQHVLNQGALFYGKSFPATSCRTTPKTAPRAVGCQVLLTHPHLDGLRALAVLGVLFEHFGLPLPVLFPLRPASVSAFFSYSAAISITLSLWKVSGRNSPRTTVCSRFTGQSVPVLSQPPVAHWARLFLSGPGSSARFSASRRFARSFSGSQPSRPIITSPTSATGRKRFPISGRWPCRNNFTCSGPLSCSPYRDAGSSRP